MKKTQLILTALLGVACSCSALAVSELNNTTAEMPQQCQRLFTETENLIADAEKQPGTHTQVSKIKNKLSQSKKQIMEMDLAVQLKSCDQGLAKLTHLKRQDHDEE